MARRVLIWGAALALAGCGGLAPGDTAGATPAAPAAAAKLPRNPAPAAKGALGRVVVTLGNPADTGLWVKTALVAQDTPGRIVTDTGRTLALTLRPLAGGAAGGAQISLQALQELGLPLAGLADVAVIATP